VADKPDVIEMFTIFRSLELANGPVLQPLERLDAVAEIWADVLDDVPAADLKVAAKMHARNSSFWPKPADIRKLCPSIQKQTAQIEAAKNDDGMGIWPKVLKYVGSLGTNCKPEEWKRRIVRDLPCDPERAPAIIAGIEAAGWRQIAQSDNEWTRKELGKAFSRAYQNQAITGGKVIGLNDYKRIAGGRNVE